jgi:hypothetical protein
MIIDDAPAQTETLYMEGPMLNIFCPYCGHIRPHHHMHQMARVGEGRMHVVGSEHFICTECGAVTHDVDPLAKQYPFKLDKAA